MDILKQMLIINGKDKTDSVASFVFENGKCNVVYTSAPKVYSYHSSNVRLLTVQETIDPTSIIVTAGGLRLMGIEQILDFGAFYRIVRSGKKARSYLKNDVAIEQNCLANKNKWPAI